MRHYQFFTLDFLIMSLLNLPVKACIRYILLNFFFSSNDRPYPLYFIKFLFFHQIIDLQKL